jgi:hypothetical protein
VFDCNIDVSSRFSIGSNEPVLWILRYEFQMVQTETCASTTLKDGLGLKLGNRDQQALYIVLWDPAIMISSLTTKLDSTPSSAA